MDRGMIVGMAIGIVIGLPLGAMLIDRTGWIGPFAFAAILIGVWEGTPWLVRRARKRNAQ